MNKPISRTRLALAVTLTGLLLPGFALAQSQSQLQIQSGKVQTPGPFDSIEVAGSAEIRFQQGNVNQIIVEGDDEVQQSVSLSVNNNRLIINQQGSWKFWGGKQRPVLNITARDLKRISISGAADFAAKDAVQVGRLVISISGAGQVRFEQLKGDELRFAVSGAGEGRVAGQVGKLELSISGKGEFLGENLQAQSAKVAVSGVGDAKLWVTQELSVSIAGIGNLEHWGGASVKRSVAGMGKVIDRGPKRTGT